MFCPNCGFKNKPGNRFCQNCGFDLAKFNNQNNNSESIHMVRRQANRIKQNTHPVQPQMPPRNFQPRKSPNQKHNNILIIVLIIILAGLVFFGVRNYETNGFPFNYFESSVNNHKSESPSSNSSSISYKQKAQDKTTPVKEFWNRIGNKLNSASSNGGSENYSVEYDSSNNNNLKGMKDWLGQVQSNINNGAIDVQDIKTYNFSTNGNIVKYKVRYDFKVNKGAHKGHDHIQIFNWKAHVNNNNKITSMNSSKGPVDDYDK